MSQKTKPEKGKADAIAKSHPLAVLRAAACPLAAWETSDPALTVRAGLRALNGRMEETPVLQWDTCSGLVGVNKKGLEAQEAMEAEKINTQNPVECLDLISEKCPDKALVYLHNAHRIFAEPSPTQSLPFVQALWNLRDKFKGTGATLVLLGPSFTLPVELKNDVVIVTEPLPDAAELGRIVDSIQADAGLEPFPDREKIIDALLGLSAFGAEQSLALSIRSTGLDRDELWERKRKMVEQTQGLSVWRGVERFDDIGGCQNVKQFIRGVCAGKNAPRCICFQDEIEKQLTGSGGGDLSGVSSDFLGALLTFMQDKQATGIIFIGPPGAAKSMVAKAAGNEAGIPTVQMDMGGMKGSLVGQSEQRIRDGLKVVDAVGQGRVLFIATCNSFGSLPPELKRRFTLGCFYFDLPDSLERAEIWAKYKRKYEETSPTPPDEGWTGAEIRQCCDIAYRIGCTLAEAAKFIVPVAKSAADQIETLRKQASGKFISASYAGVYRYEKTAQPAPTGRLMGV